VSLAAIPFWSSFSTSGRLAFACLALTGTTCIGYRTPLDDGGASDAGDAATGRIVPCTAGTVALTRAKPTVMFLLDRSTSMSEPMVNGTIVPTRWDALAEALRTVLPPIDTSVAIGALVFPSIFDDDSSCWVDSKPDLMPSTGNVAALSRLMRSVDPTGSTPTAAAIETASQILLGMRTASTARAMVLATDGGPGCNPDLNPRTCTCMVSIGPCKDVLQCLDDKHTVETIASYRKRGLPTYVIGIESPADVEFSGVLDAMAVAGGRALTGGARRYYRATSSADLDKALTDIRNQVGTCTYLTSSVPSGGGSIVVKVDGKELDADRWAWGDRSNGELYFLGATCQELAAKAAPSITATVACSDG
jgi:hypothetical protein